MSWETVNTILKVQRYHGKRRPPISYANNNNKIIRDIIKERIHSFVLHQYVNTIRWLAYALKVCNAIELKKFGI